MFAIARGRVNRGFMLATATVMALSYLFVTLTQLTPVHAAEVTSRSIAMASTVENAETNYAFQFTVAAGTTIGAVRIEFCDNSPLPHATCTNAAVGDDVPEVDGVGAGSIATESGTAAFAFSGAATCTNPALTAPADGDRYLEIICNTAETFAGATTFTGTVNNIDNPSNTTDSPNNPNNTFYARIYVYTDVTPPAVANPFTTTEVVHTGGIALSTAEQITVTARVQEVLHFCVGTTDAASANDCTDISGNTVDIGVVESGAVSVSPVAAGSGGNNVNGLAMVRTNAANGVVIDYFAQQASSGTNHLGSLRVTGASCNAGNVQTDQCFLSAGAISNGITAGTEEYGMTISSIDTSNGTTTNLARDAAYDGDGVQSGELCDNGDDTEVDEDCWAWTEAGTADRLATASTVVDDEMLVLRYAATAAITTPTGTYTVTSTYIATPTF